MKNLPISYTRIPLIILITAFIIGACLFIGTCNTSPPTVKPDKTQVGKAEEKVSVIDKNYQKENALLKTSSDSLQKELFHTKQSLKTTKVKLFKSQSILIALAQKDTAGRSINEQQSDCDSLKQEAVLFAAIVDSAKAEYECNIMQFENLLAIKDSEIVICSNSYSALKSLMDQNLDRERQLTQDLQIAYKVQRRKIIQNKILAGGFLILSGITTTLFINSTK